MTIKTYLSKHGYVVKKEFFENDRIQELKNTLTARPLTSGEFFTQDNSYPVYIETKNKLYIPKMFGLSNFGTPDGYLVNYHGKEWSSEIEFKGNLMKHQIEPCKLLYDFCVKNGGGILSLSTGLGKTFSCLKVLSQLRGKTIVVVNKISLLKQWEMEIKQFLPNAKIGILQGQKNIDIEGKDIVLAMLQSLTRVDYPDNFFDDYAVTVIDEAHNLSSQTFSKIFFKITSKYTIGLTATPQRSDGCENVFKWHIGDIVYQSGAREVKGLAPHIINLKLSSNEYKEVSTTNRFTGKEQIQFTTMLSELVNMKKRNLLIRDLIVNYISENRKILVLSERRSHIMIIKKLLDEIKPDFTYGLFLGSMKVTDLEKSKKCDVILASIAAFGEGVSEKDLDTLILTTPKKFVKNSEDSSKKKDSGKLNQIIGRILRKEHTERNPLIVDLQDDFSVYKYQAVGRRTFYKTYFNNCTMKHQSVDLDTYNSIQDIKKVKSKQIIESEESIGKLELQFTECLID